MLPQSRIMGHIQAESDEQMLAHAFIKTPEYNTLLSSSACAVVIGRRGSGKSATYLQLKQHFGALPKHFLVCITPDELDVHGLKQLCTHFGTSYAEVRSTSRLVWLFATLTDTLSELVHHYRTKVGAIPADVLAIQGAWDDMKGHSTTGKAYQFITSILNCKSPPRNLTDLSHQLNSRSIKATTLASLRALNYRVTILLDKLDDGWLPDEISSAFVAGLLDIANDFNSTSSPIQVIAFVRDNIYRAIARLDSNYTHDFEGHEVRLHWDEPLLFNLACARIRHSLGLATIQRNEKVWDRFVSDELHGRDGFKRCLRLTLYRPRDLIGLLNEAYSHATRHNRPAVSPADLDASATQISNSRLADLIKEYDSVLPGIANMISAFRGANPRMAMQEALERISAEIEEAIDPVACQHFALFGPSGVFQSLYSVGFIGIWDSQTNQFQFRHDGGAPDNSISTSQSDVLIHPCYHIALNCTFENIAPVADNIFDETEITVVSEQIVARKREIGKLLTEVETIQKGDHGWRAYETWCKRVLQIVCAGQLVNFEKVTTGVNQPDLVASNLARQDSFWRRLKESYETQQVAFEVKNYDEPTADDIRQVSDYLSGAYGRAAIIITRGNDENLTSPVLDWVRDKYAAHKKLCIVLPQKIVIRLLSKVRSTSKHDEVGTQLNKILDRYERTYLRSPTPTGKRKGRR